jgi:hypothetical protein
VAIYVQNVFEKKILELSDVVEAANVRSCCPAEGISDE